MAWKQDDEEPAHPAVSVEERVDRLELNMRQTGPDERRELVLPMYPLLQRCESAGDFIRRWRDESSVTD